MSLKEYRFIGGHADELEGGRPVEPGEFTGPIDGDLTQNAHLIEEGVLIEVPKGAAKSADKADANAAKDDEKDGDG